MAQQKPEPPSSKAPGAPGGPRPRSWLLPTAAAVLVALGGAFFFLYEDEPVVEESTPRAVSLAPRNFLSARARIPRPPSVDPAKFTDPEVRSAYQVARNVPGLLEQMPCYCGCFTSSGHSSNYDCFVDDHGVTWPLCRTIALEAQKQHSLGVPVPQIKRSIDERYAR